MQFACGRSIKNNSLALNSGRINEVNIMSRIGKKPIKIPEGVEVKIDSEKIAVKGPKGELFQKSLPEISVEIKEKEILIVPKTDSKRNRALWGLTRAVLANMIIGVVNGYNKKLEIEGIGYKAQVEGEDLSLNVGFSHPVKVKCPQGIKFLVEKNVITVSGIDKELVGLIASKIKKIKKPEPYKGKGIRYQGEIIKRKAGKRVVTAGK